jgi:hypothetical protein
MTIRKLKALFWFLGLLGFLGAGYTFYDIWEGKRSGRYQATEPEYYHELIRRDLHLVEEDAATQSYYSKERYETLWTARIDGSWPAPPKELTEGADQGNTPTQVQLEKLDEVVSISSIIWSTEPFDRFIALHYLKDQALTGPRGKAQTIHVSEGSVMRSPYDEPPYNARVLAIGAQTVTFQWGDDEIVLSPRLGSDGTGVPIAQVTIPLADDPTEGFDGVPDETVEIAPGRWLLGQNDLEEIRADPQKILSEDLSMRSLPPPADGGRSSLELTKVKDGSLPARYGFASGDRLISVNGIPMTSQVAAVNWYKANPDEPAYTIVYERRGAVKSTTIHVN